MNGAIYKALTINGIMVTSLFKPTKVNGVKLRKNGNSLLLTALKLGKLKIVTSNAVKLKFNNAQQWF